MTTEEENELEGKGVAFRLQHTTPPHNKEYIIIQNENVVEVLWGRIGSKYTRNEYKFANFEQAEKWAKDQRSYKLAKGYHEVSFNEPGAEFVPITRMRR